MIFALLDRRTLTQENHSFPIIHYYLLTHLIVFRLPCLENGGTLVRRQTRKREEESNDQGVREVKLMGKWGLTKQAKGEKNGRKRCRVGGRERGEGTRGKAGCA